MPFNANTTQRNTANQSDISRLAEKYRFNPQLVMGRGGIGRHEGCGTGSSIEFQDFRDYVPGDDPRHIDWAAFSRTDRMVVRLYREEISPYLDIICDTSASMNIQDGRKGTLIRELVSWISASASSNDFFPCTLLAGTAIMQLFAEETIQYEDTTSCLFTDPQSLYPWLRRNAIRVLISDFMTPHSFREVLQHTAQNSARLLVIRVLGPWERSPTPMGPSQLFDVENKTNQHDLNIDLTTIKAYKKRLNKLTLELQQQSRAVGATFLDLHGDQQLENILKDTFLPAELVSI